MFLCLKKLFFCLKKTSSSVLKKQVLLYKNVEYKYQ